MLALFEALNLCFPQHLSEDIDDRALIQIEVVGALDHVPNVGVKTVSDREQETVIA